MWCVPLSHCIVYFILAVADLQDGHVIWPDGQPPAQRLQTDAVRQPAHALCRSVLFLLSESDALPRQLPLHGSSSPGQPSSLVKHHRKEMFVSFIIYPESLFFLSLRCPTRLFLRHLQTLCHRRLLSTAILSQTKNEVTDLYDKLYFFSTFVHVKKFTSSSFVSSIAVTAESDSGMKKLQSNVHLLVINISHTEDGCLYPCTHEGFIVNLRCTH